MSCHVMSWMSSSSSGEEMKGGGLMIQIVICHFLIRILGTDGLTSEIRGYSGLDLHVECWRGKSGNQQQRTTTKFSFTQPVVIQFFFER